MADQNLFDLMRMGSRSTYSRQPDLTSPVQQYSTYSRQSGLGGDLQMPDQPPITPPGKRLDLPQQPTGGNNDFFALAVENPNSPYAKGLMRQSGGTFLEGSADKRSGMRFPGMPVKVNAEKLSNQYGSFMNGNRNPTQTEEGLQLLPDYGQPNPAEVKSQGAKTMPMPGGQVGGQRIKAPPMRPMSRAGLLPNTDIGVQQQGGLTQYVTPQGTATFQGQRKGGGSVNFLPDPSAQMVQRGLQNGGLDRDTALLQVNPGLYRQLMDARKAAGARGDWGAVERSYMSPEEKRISDQRWSLQRQLQPLQSSMTLGEQAAIAQNNRRIQGQISAFDTRQQTLASAKAAATTAQRAQADLDRRFQLDQRKQAATEIKNENDYLASLNRQRDDQDKTLNGILDAQGDFFKQVLEDGMAELQLLPAEEREQAMQALYAQAQNAAEQFGDGIAQQRGYIRAYTGEYLSPQDVDDFARAARKQNPKLTDEQIIALIRTPPVTDSGAAR